MPQKLNQSLTMTGVIVVSSVRLGLLKRRNIWVHGRGLSKEEEATDNSDCSHREVGCPTAKYESEHLADLGSNPVDRSLYKYLEKYAL